MVFYQIKWIAIFTHFHWLLKLRINLAIHCFGVGLNILFQEIKNEYQVIPLVTLICFNVTSLEE